MGRVRAFAVSVTLALVVSVAFAAGAGAHVTVQPGTQKQGASDVLVTFAVPNEEATASTTKVEVVFPTATPLLGVHAQAMAGWTVTVETAKLPKPVTTDDGDITEAVSKVTWTANDVANAVGPDQFGAFTVLVGTLPSNTKAVAFKAVQTYSDGTVVSWIEPVVKGTPAPEHPTPILKLVK
jgi:uncharacterized protein YcnI